MEYELKVTFTEPMLASSPADPEIYKQYIQSRARDEAEEKGDEVESLDSNEREKVGWSVFHRDKKEDGKPGDLFIFDYKVRGFMKEAASAITGKALTAYKSKIDKWLFVTPRKIYLENSNGRKAEPDGVLERPLRAMTMQGPRVSLKRSDTVDAGTSFKCRITILPLGQSELTEERLREWLEYGKWSGFGEWRSGSYGRFTFELKKLA